MLIFTQDQIELFCGTKFFYLLYKNKLIYILFDNEKFLKTIFLEGETKLDEQDVDILTGLLGNESNRIKVLELLANLARIGKFM